MTKPDNTITRPEALLAVLIGVVLSLFVWIGVPYSNYLIGNSPMADNYLPPAAIAFLLVIILFVNPALRKFASGRSLRSPQLAIIITILLFSCVPISSGLLRSVPYGIANATLSASQDRSAGQDFPGDDIPSSLFPEDMAYGAEVDRARSFILQLSPQESIPWSAWLGPSITWALFAAVWWAMMLGLALVVLPQWRESERLSFPLHALQEKLIEEPAAGKLYNATLRAKSFWWAVGAVCFVHFISGLNQYSPSAVPEFPLDWNIGSFFSRDPWRFLPEYIKTGHLYFTFVGLAFLMPNRMAFSIWFFALAYGIYTMLGTSYLPTFEKQTVTDHRTGAMIAFTVGIIWMGRSHWAVVMRSIVGRSRNEDSARNRFAGFLFSTGFIGLVSWIFWSGASFHWAILYTILLVMYALLITRIVAETGLILVGFEGSHFDDIIKLFPVSWVSSASAFIGAAIGSIAGFASRIFVSVHGIQGIALLRDHGLRRERTAIFGLLGILLAGLAIGGVVHLKINYSHGNTLDGLEQPINTEGVASFDSSWALLEQKDAGAWDRPPYNQLSHIGFGAALAGGLQYACLTMPRFPFHPIGLVLVYTWYMEQIWISIFIGWSLKMLIVRYGGARFYSRARPFFYGLILGEIIAATLWAIVPAILIFLGRPYVVIEVLEVLRDSFRMGERP